MTEMERNTLILTGASRGIGHATAKRFADENWRVITCSRQAFSADCPWLQGPDDHVQIDLSDQTSLADGIAGIRTRLHGDPVQALVNNAGISPKTEKAGRLGALDMSLETWWQVFNVNFFAPLELARGLRSELERGGASIVNVTSIAGTRVHPFASSAYATSKAALSALTREMASDLGPWGIRVNSIAPGEIDTSILSPGTEKLTDALPLKRIGTPQEVASMIFFLCSDQSSYVSGAEIHVNGGQHV